MNYYEKLNNNALKKYNIAQFIDRYNIVAYYRNAHIYTNELSSAQLNPSEIQQRSESTLALSYLLGNNVKKVIEEDLNIIFKNLDAFKNGHICKENKSIIMTEIFKHDKLLKMLQDDSITMHATLFLHTILINSCCTFCVRSVIVTIEK